MRETILSDVANRLLLSRLDRGWYSENLGWTKAFIHIIYIVLLSVLYEYVEIMYREFCCLEGKPNPIR